LKALRIIFFLLITMKAYGQIAIGTGIVWIEFDGSTTVDFYKAQNDEVYNRRILIYEDSDDEVLTLKDYHKRKNWLQPEVMQVDAYHLNFRCKSQTEKWFEVVVNNEKGSTMWLKRSEQTKFQSWKEYLISMFGIARLNAKIQGIYEAPDEGAKKIETQGKDCFQVRDMKGDWIEIYSSDECNSEDRTEIKSAWIKWKEGEKILISYNTTG